MSVKTSLPNVCDNSGDLQVSFEVFDNFEEGRDALRAVVRKYAFSKNSMFDGNGNIIYLKKYAGTFESESCVDNIEILDFNRMNYVTDSLRKAFSGTDVDFEMESYYCSDWMIAIESEPGMVSFCGDEDGPYNGYNPDIRTNIFRMDEEKHYYLYINDRFGQDDSTSELYIDLKKAEIK